MSFLKAFNNHLKEFITDITTVLPKDSELRTTKFFLEGLIKIKPSQIEYSNIITRIALKRVLYCI